MLAERVQRLHVILGVDSLAAHMERQPLHLKLVVVCVRD